MFKQYVGDGVYVEAETTMDFKLTTEDGMMISNSIYLDTTMLKFLDEYMTHYVPTRVAEIKAAEKIVAEEARQEEGREA